VGVARGQSDCAHGSESHGFSGLVVPLDRVVCLSEAGAASLPDHVSSATKSTQGNRTGARDTLATDEQPVSFSGLRADFVLLSVVAL